MSELEITAQRFAENVAPAEQFNGDEEYQDNVWNSIKGDFIEGFIHASESFLEWERNGLNLQEEFQAYTNNDYTSENIDDEYYIKED